MFCESGLYTVNMEKLFWKKESISISEL